MTKLMLEKGAKHPAMIAANSSDQAAGLDRRLGFEKALQEAGIVPDARMIETAQFHMDSGYDKAARLFSARTKPDALFCATDTIAAGAMEYCRENGIRIPNDLMIAGIGDSRMGKLLYVPLSSVHLHYKTAGTEGAKMLLSQMKNSSEVHRILQLEYEIMERESTNRMNNVHKESI